MSCANWELSGCPETCAEDCKPVSVWVRLEGVPWPVLMALPFSSDSNGVLEATHLHCQSHKDSERDVTVLTSNTGSSLLSKLHLSHWRRRHFECPEAGSSFWDCGWTNISLKLKRAWKGSPGRGLRQGLPECAHWRLGCCYSFSLWL